MKKYLILTILLSMLFATAYSTPRRQIMTFREARLMEPRVVDFIKDVVIPVAKSADYRSDEDLISVEVFCESDTSAIVDVNICKESGAYLINNEVDMSSAMQYLTYIDSIPIFLYSECPTRLIEVQKSVRKLIKVVYPTLWKVDDCATWRFKLHNEELSFDAIYDYAAWITDKLYRSLLPPEIRIKKLDYIAPRIPLPAVAEKEVRKAQAGISVQLRLDKW